MNDSYSCAFGRATVRAAFAQVDGLVATNGRRAWSGLVAVGRRTRNPRSGNGRGTGSPLAGGLGRAPLPIGATDQRGGQWAGAGEERF